MANSRFLNQICISKCFPFYFLPLYAALVQFSHSALSVVSKTVVLFSTVMESTNMGKAERKRKNITHQVFLSQHMDMYFVMSKGESAQLLACVNQSKHIQFCLRM